MHNEIRHHGIKGQKWGVRRFQNKDGSLTPKGKDRYRDKKPMSDEGKNKIIDSLIKGVADNLIVDFASEMLIKAGLDKVALYGNLTAKSIIVAKTIIDVNDTLKEEKKK